MSIMKYSCQRDQISPAALQSLSRLSLFPPHKNCFPGGLGKSHSVSVKKVIGPQLLPRCSYEFFITGGKGSKETCFYSLLIGDFYSSSSFPSNPSELLWHVLPAISTFSRLGRSVSGTFWKVPKPNPWQPLGHRISDCTLRLCTCNLCLYGKLHPCPTQAPILGLQAVPPLTSSSYIHFSLLGFFKMKIQRLYIISMNPTISCGIQIANYTQHNSKNENSPLHKTKS